MKILVLGSGGREHAICWKLKQSPLVEALYCAPGNAGIAEAAECVALPLSDFKAIAGFCKDHAIDLVFPGPEQPLVDGITDFLEKAGIRVFGPSAKAAQLEGSKAFTKRLCDKYHIPTAAYRRFADVDSARTYIKTRGAPIVIKADGLAAGKGVTVAATVEQAIAAVEECFSGKFGVAGESVVVEECLEGEEISFFALSDGENVIEFGSAQDHKRVGDGDTGPNTGGMGTYAPAPALTDALRQEVMDTMIRPAVEGMRKDGIPFKGVLFAGLMLTKTGPKLLEFNTRFGDPETQVLMKRLDSDLAAILMAGAKGTLDQVEVKIKAEAALCVVMAASGYPGDYVKGTEIRGLEKAAAVAGVSVFHAGTTSAGGKTLANGGRVLGVTASAPSLAEARERAYQAVDAIEWKDGFCRRDIGWRALAKAA